ncbi:MULTISPECIES: hypothetical protein [Burkholderia]|uniref:hypothetical protein n=1 Tax=Burkholderia TaxID=32008 RepID=UPI0007576456|nr:MULTISPECIES: hypothetical protein [Burkholderia]KVF27621.1 hypothetical protein WJ08_25635 [Burkholderia vietnamiensis]KVF38856.1 hypothetical protein WJ10_01195 [Burkholderia vietnamiensis]MBR8234215.1 hypothetical protein [Burkholderia sp. AU32357]
MKKVWQWVEVGFAMCALGIVTAFLVYAFKEHSEGAAAWIQAVGSIGAIIGAYYIGRWQAAAAEIQAKRVRDEILKGKQLAARAIADAAYGEVKAANNAIGDTYLVWRHWFHYRPSVFSAQIEAISRLQLFELDDADAMRSIIDLQNSMLSMQHIFTKAEKMRADYNGNPPGDGVSSHDLIGYVNAAYEAYIRIRNRFYDEATSMEAIEHPRARR